MILEQLFILTSYLMGDVDSYVLFAANIDDFRSLANKIIPNQLADQLANMAAKGDRLNYRHDVNEAISEESNDDSSKDQNSDDSTEDSNYSDSYYTASPLKDKERSHEKKYLLQNENIDLDELVKRVKEKLEKDYNVSTDNRNVVNDKSNSDETTPAQSEHKVKIEDYYYKDDAMNGDFNKDSEYAEYEAVEKIISPTFTIEQNNHEVAPQYEGENIVYNDEDAIEAADYLDENIKNTEYAQENLNENMDYDPVTVKQQLDHVATLKEIVRDGVQQIRKFDEYGNIVTREPRPSVKMTDKSISEYYKITSKQPTVVKIINNPNKINIQADTQPTVQEIPEYYEDNVKETQIEPAGDAIEIFKEVDMLKPTNDSYEDYVTPQRDNIFDSAESTRKPSQPILGIHKFKSPNTVFKVEHSRPKAFIEPLKIPEKAINDDVIKPPTKKVSGRTPHPEFIRAKTASMWYKDPNIENYDDSTKKIQENANEKTTKKHLRTMFPTKAHIKISSPNYFAKLPAVGEKYNFDEPIPEKDREPELIKHIGNPPATINKKVKL